MKFKKEVPEITSDQEYEAIDAKNRRHSLIFFPPIFTFIVLALASVVLTWWNWFFIWTGITLLITLAGHILDVCVHKPQEEALMNFDRKRKGWFR